MHKKKALIGVLTSFLDDTSSSSSSDDDDLVRINALLELAESVCNLPKNENYYEETVEDYNDKQFIEHFRVSREVVHFLVNKFETSAYYPKKDTGFARIEARKCIVIFLWFAGHQTSSVRDVADRFNIAISTLHRIIQDVTMFLSSLSNDVIKWPNDEEKTIITNEFREMGFPDVLGCIDGSHIKIDTPSEDPESYYNRKKYYSIQMQLVCDSRRVIRDIFIGYPGSVHDRRVYRNSPLSESLAEKCGNSFLLGDSAYPCLRNLLVPYRDYGNLTRVERDFNKKLSHCRILVEHTFGILKQKFRQLYHIKLRDIDTICHFIRACCVLYNLTLNEEFDLEEIYDENALENDYDEIQGDDEEEGNQAGIHFRNYIAMTLNM